MNTSTFVISCMLIGFCYIKPTAGKNTVDFKNLPHGIEAKDFVIIGGETYYISPAPNSYRLPIEAIRTCHSINMKLVSLENEEKFRLISDYLVENGLFEVYWTSGRDVNYSWIWAGIGQEIEYFKWAEEPIPSTHNTCLLLTGDKGLYDSTCDVNRLFICEF